MSRRGRTGRSSLAHATSEGLQSIGWRWPMAPRTARSLVLALVLGGAALALPPPTAAQSHWSPTRLAGAPAARAGHTAVWTGSKMIVWGGSMAEGGIYDPVSDTWQPMSVAGAPSARTGHTAVWTGSKMVVWGGGSSLATGGVYDPGTDTWTATSAANAPSGRSLHTAVWTGSRMIVWGGTDAVSPLASGASYDPMANTWSAVSSVGATARSWHAAVWTGSRMIVWGGRPPGASYPSTNTGAVYDPGTNVWTDTSTAGAPLGRVGPTGVWTGSKMIVWGGTSSDYWNTGGVYDPDATSWTATTTTGAPSGRYSHTAAWTGSRMIVWGGAGWALTTTNTGGLYDPVANAWTPTSMAGVPIARFFFAGVWTGSRLIVWGGRESGSTVTLTDTGGAYGDPALPQSPTDYFTLTPCRLADTRNADGPTGGPILGGKTTRTFPVAGGACGVPSTAVAVSVNLTAVGAAAAGYLTLFPGNALGPPLASSINFTAGSTRANNAIVPLATDGAGTIQVKNGSAGTAHFVLDVNGYFQ